VRQSGAVIIDQFSDVWTVGEVQALARAICVHPTITSFEDSSKLPSKSLDAMYSALATLPALESVKLSNRKLHTRPEDEIILAYPERLTEVLRVPSLRSVCFRQFDFTSALCEATGNALMDGTAITNLKFENCSFPAGEYATILANGLSRNTSVISISVRPCKNARALYSALAVALTSNSTLRHLELSQHYVYNDDGHDLSPILSALAKNTELKTLKVHCYGSMDESLYTAMKYGRELNETLESLELNVHLHDENSGLWCRALSFLRTNKALKSLVISPGQRAEESCLSAFCIGIVAMLQENTSLESICIRRWAMKNKGEEYFALITALQCNTTLKILSLNLRVRLELTLDESEQMTSLLKENYALESLPDVDLENDAGDVGAILRLNEAGRRYLIEDGSSISKGVEVLSAVSNQIDCVFLHLLENLRLCDRSAVEMVTNPNASSGGGGKREQASAHKSKEARRRLA
jgi:hypothetical protein